MRFRSLDINDDWNFGRGIESYVIDDNAIALDIRTSILSFFKDCWFDPNAGIDWLRLLGSKSTQKEIELNVRGTILRTTGVTKVNSISSVFRGRRLTVSYNINTIFSQNSSQIVEVV